MQKPKVQPIYKGGSNQQREIRKFCYDFFLSFVMLITNSQTTKISTKRPNTNKANARMDVVLNQPPYIVGRPKKRKTSTNPTMLM